MMYNINKKYVRGQEISSFNTKDAEFDKRSFINRYKS